ncbi:hypothetical protein KKC94_00315 [Patescibacteria group bacterium]|nr:hypothetical protein [Patescibacteria group bacterium]
MDDSTKINPLYDPSTDNQEINPKVQEMINKPMSAQGGFSAEDKTFLDMLMKMVDGKQIDLYKPESLINHTVYDKISDADKGKADLNAINMLARIRDIYSLLKSNSEPTFQVQNMVMDLRYKKEQLEKIGGDLFII